MRMNRRGAIGAAVLAFAMLAAACGSGDGTDPGGGPDISIGAQDFGESAILAEIYRGALEASGFTASVQPVGGFRDLELGAFDSGDINLAPEYAASMLEFLNGQAGEATGDAKETTDLLNAELASIDLVALTPSDAVDTNAFVITEETSSSLGITSLSDLASKGADLTLGGPPDCETNPFCIPGLESVYGLDLSATFQPLDAGQITVQALEAGQIDVAILFSTSGIIADRGFVLLTDDKSMLAADNVVPVLSVELRDAHGDAITSVLDDVSSKLTTADLTAMNKRFDIDTEDADAIAADWLADNGF
jgi:osmoprotectant transport system substrate-binding protein